MCSRSARTPICCDDVALARLRHRDEPRDRARDLHLHAEEAVPAAQREAAPRRWWRAARSRSRSTVIGWCSVASTGQPSSIIPSSPEPRHWLSWMRSKSARRGPSSRRARRLNVYGSGKPADAHDGELLEVDRGLELPRPRHPERVRRAGRGRGSGPSRAASGSSSSGYGWPGEHRDLVAELGELAGEVPGVHALAAAVRVAPVDQPGDAETARAATA